MNQEIVKCVIHPAIGIARVGNSELEYYIGPEVPGAIPDANGSFKDNEGKIKRQVARFRIFGLNAAGEVVRELEATDSDVDVMEWTVHLANKKSAWFNFDLALDITVAGPNHKNVQSKLRNLEVTDREKLVIDPGPSSIRGTLARVPLPACTFMDLQEPIKLGELRTDHAGNLLVFGGEGKSASYTHLPAVTFGNNDGWHDDTSDGPVSARVVLNGREIEVTPAWVLVAPPDYAPGVLGAVTLYDIVYDVAMEMDPTLRPERVSFTEHILPMFQRLNQNQWVNKGFYLNYGWGAERNYLEAEWLTQLADNSPANQEFRENLLNRFRSPYDTGAPNSPYTIPPMYGDGMGEAMRNSDENLAMTKTQYQWLVQWANGDFDSDLTTETLADPNRPNTKKIEDYPVAERPAALDRAALEHALGGAFHPGCEATWPMRHASMYEAPFRIKAAPQGSVEKVYTADDRLTQVNIYASNGPLTNNRPGDLTRWMAVPWQTDTSSCRYGYYEDEAIPYLPTFWPARVPNQVLGKDEYDAIMNSSLSDAERREAFNKRLEWLRDYPASDYETSINNFIAQWSELGIVVGQPGPTDTADFPAVIHVEMDYKKGQTAKKSSQADATVGSDKK